MSKLDFENSLPSQSANYLNLTINFLLINFNETNAIGQAMSDTINEIYVKNDIRFDILMLGNTSKLFDIASEIQKRNSGSYAFEFKLISSSNLITKSSVILTSDRLQLFNIFESLQNLQNNYSVPNKFLIYNEELHVSKLDEMLEMSPPMDEFNYKRYMNNYFIVNAKFGYALMTSFITQSDKVYLGYELQLESVSLYHKKFLKWNKNFDQLKEKSVNFRNYFVFFNIVTCKTKYDCYTDKFSGEDNGVMIELLKLVGEKEGFKSIFIFHNENFSSKWNHSTRSEVAIFPSLRSESDLGINHITSFYSEEKYQFIITPPESYTSYEKLFLPFDRTTWVILAITFLTAFFVTVIVNNLSQNIQDLIYGDDVRMPGFNITRIFFGIGQTKLPIAHFPRFILTLFIIFCLIIRSAYQGVLFELITADLKKSSPETIDDLIARNFTFYFTDTYSNYLMSQHLQRYSNLNLTDRMVQLSQSEFEDFYADNYEDASAKIAFFADEHNLNVLNNACNCSNLLLNQVLFSYGKALGVIRNHYLVDKIDKVIQRIIPFGIPQHFAEYHKWVFYKPLNVVSEELKPFSIDSLSFGFVLWLAACGISFMAFIWELMRIKLRRHLRTLIGLILFLILLNIRLKYGCYL